MEEITYKTCTACKKRQPITEYYHRKTDSRDGHMGRCRTCCKEDKRKSYEKRQIVYKVENPVNRPKYFTCKDYCAKYPCFRGIENCKCNLSLTCLNFKEK